MNTSTRRAMILILPLFFMAGCASVNKAPAEQDLAAKKFAVNPSTAQLYIYRDQTFGAAISMPVTVNGKLLGTTGPKSFFKLDLEAGTHTITSQGGKSSLDVQTRSGDIYYVWQQVKMGLVAAGSKLQLVDAEKGQKGVAKSTLIKSDF